MINGFRGPEIITASKMSRYRLLAGLYSPFASSRMKTKKVIQFSNMANRRLCSDSLRTNQLALLVRGLDDALERTLRRACGWPDMLPLVRDDMSLAWASLLCGRRSE